LRALGTSDFDDRNLTSTSVGRRFPRAILISKPTSNAQHRFGCIEFQLHNIASATFFNAMNPKRKIAALSWAREKV
jgi:hypothetical protein